MNLQIFLEIFKNKINMIGNIQNPIQMLPLKSNILDVVFLDILKYPINKETQFLLTLFTKRLTNKTLYVHQ